MNAIECQNLGKIFREKAGERVALSDLTFSVPAGRITGLLGPDGAGKTTLLRILAGLFHPTSGSAKVLGMDVVREAAGIQNVIGYMPQRFGLYENLSVEENLQLYAGLHSLSRERREARFGELLKMTDLLPFRKRMAGALSGGMKQKLALACALIPEPGLLLLDEPTVGVDVLSRRELWRILRSLADEGRITVLASTAYLDEAAYCDRTLILFEGRLIADSTPAEICRKAEGKIANPTFENGFQYLLSGTVPPPLKRKKRVEKDAPERIVAENLVKKFGSFVAVDHVSFSVRQGEIFGLLGANGAGKTTTFRMLCGLSAADGGRIEIGGVNLRRAPGSARMKIGYVAQKFSLYTDLTTEENLRFFGGAYGLSGSELNERIVQVADEFGLREFFHLKTQKLPLGFKQRLSMACALLHRPGILFLDEATSGADPMARREFWERIMALADQGVAVIITTHFLDEAEYCDRMVIMQAGAAVASGTVAEIREMGREKDGTLPSLEEAFVNIIRRGRGEREGAE